MYIQCNAMCGCVIETLLYYRRNGSYIDGPYISLHRRLDLSGSVVVVNLRVIVDVVLLQDSLSLVMSPNCHVCP